MWNYLLFSECTYLPFPARFFPQINTDICKNMLVEVAAVANQQNRLIPVPLEAQELNLILNTRSWRREDRRIIDQGMRDTLSLSLGQLPAENIYERNFRLDWEQLPRIDRQFMATVWATRTQVLLVEIEWD